MKSLILGKQRGDWQIRFTEHLRSIKNNSPGLPVAAHFNSSERSIFNIKASVITICDNETYRKTKEELLIYKLGTLEPRGMYIRLQSLPVSIETP